MVQVLDEAESARLARVLVAHEVDPDNFAALGEHAKDVALSQVEGQATDKDMCRVLVLCVPRSGLGVRGRKSSLAGVQALDFFADAKEQKSWLEVRLERVFLSGHIAFPWRHW